MDTVEPVDIIAAGFPGQDISNAGKRAGITGVHRSLWTAVADAVRALQPSYVLVENVAALLRRGLDDVHADLAALGYDVTPCFGASDTGPVSVNCEFAHVVDAVLVVAGTLPPDGGASAEYLAATGYTPGVGSGPARRPAAAPVPAAWPHAHGLQGRVRVGDGGRRAGVRR